MTPNSEAEDQTLATDRKRDKKATTKAKAKKASKSKVSEKISKNQLRITRTPSGAIRASKGSVKKIEKVTFSIYCPRISILGRHIDNLQL